MKDFEALRQLCEDQLKSLVTPMGREMYYRYQEWLIDEFESHTCRPASQVETMMARHNIIQPLR